MPNKNYQVTVSRVNEGAHQESEVRFRATGVEITGDGSLKFDEEQGGRIFGATTWGSVTIVRVPGSDQRT